MESSDDTALNTGMWTPDEHQRFIEAIKMFGKDWVAIEQHVQTRSAKQVKSHSQKFLWVLSRSVNPEDTILLETLKVNLRKLKKTDKQFYRNEINIKKKDELL